MAIVRSDSYKNLRQLNRVATVSADIGRRAATYFRARELPHHRQPTDYRVIEQSA